MNRPAEARKPPAGLVRALFRAPVMLYRARLGWLLGSRFMLIEHVGRRTGRIRHTVVEVVVRDRADDSYVVASGFGATAQWYRNLLAHPTAVIRVGRRRVRVDAVSLTAAAGGQIMADYAARHPRIARRLCRYLGYPVSGSGNPVGGSGDRVGGSGDDQYRAAGQHIPFLRLSVVNTPVPQAGEPAAYDLPEPDPRKDTHTVRLADGRALAYAQWGDPHGFPVFYFHGTPGSRMEGAFADRAAARHGMRLLALDRPGFGRSTFQPERRFRDWPADVCAAADALGIDTFGVIGHSGGGPHLFACGAFVPPRRLAFIGALGPWGPVATPEIVAGMHRLDRWYTTVARRAPWVMRISFAPLGWCARHTPGLFLALLRSASAPPDRAALADERLAAHLRMSEVEAFRQGGRGGAHEALMAYRDWGFDLADVRVPTHVRLGEEDIYVSPAMGRHLQARIPGVDLRRLPGQGHFAIDRWDDILAACRTHL